MKKNASVRFITLTHTIATLYPIIYKNLPWSQIFLGRVRADLDLIIYERRAFRSDWSDFWKRTQPEYTVSLRHCCCSLNLNLKSSTKNEWLRHGQWVTMHHQSPSHHTMWSWSTNVTDRRTDRRTTCNPNYQFYSGSTPSCKPAIRGPPLHQLAGGRKPRTFDPGETQRKTTTEYGSEPLKPINSHAWCSQSRPAHGVALSSTFRLRTFDFQRRWVKSNKHRPINSAAKMYRTITLLSG